MSRDVIISAENVSKKFCRSLKNTLAYGVRDVGRDIFGLTPLSTEMRPEEFWALRDVSFSVKRGECLGLIGANGAGKSTLLKLLNGIILPDTGTIRVYGRVGALLELGAGFHPMLSGRENIHLSGAILGFSKEELDEKFDEIVDFADIGEFIDSPVKHYSSGMYVRLGFAVAAHAMPDILLIDEALAVGDVVFQSRCFAKLKEFKKRGTTIIFVSHNLDLVTSHCSCALLLDKGRLITTASPKVVISEYNRLVRTHSAAHKGESHKAARTTEHTRDKRNEWSGLFQLNPNEDRYGSRKAEILEAGIFDLDNSPVQVLERNHEYKVKVKVRHNESMPAAIVAYTIRDASGQVLCGTNTYYQNIDMGLMDEGATVVIAFRQVARLQSGEYLLSCGCAAWANGHYIVYDRRFDYMTFQIVGTNPTVGLFDPGCTVEWEQSE